MIDVHRLHRPSAWNLVRAELLRIQRQMATWILSLLSLAIVTFGVVGEIIEHSRSGPETLAGSQLFYRVISGTNEFAADGWGIALLVVSARLAAENFHHGTVRLFLARGVGRAQLVLAQLAAVGIVAIGAWLTSLIVVMAVGCVLFTTWNQGLSSLTSLPIRVWVDVLMSFVAVLVSLVICILIGNAAGSIARSMVGIAVALILLPATYIVSAGLTIFAGGSRWPEVVASYQLGSLLSSLPRFLQTGAMGTGTVRIMLAVLGYAILLMSVPLLLVKLRDVRE